MFSAFVYNLSSSQTTKVLKKIWNVGKVVQLRIPAGRMFLIYLFINFFLFIRYQGAVRTSLTRYVWLCQKSRQNLAPPHSHTHLNTPFQSRWKFPVPFREKVIFNYREVNGCLGVLSLVFFNFPFFFFTCPSSHSVYFASRRSCIEVAFNFFR